MKRIAQFSSYGTVAALALVTFAVFLYGGLLASGLKVTLVSKVYADVPYLQSGYFGNYSQASYSGGTCSESGGEDSFTKPCNTYTQSSYNGFGYSQSSYGGGGGGGNGDYERPCDNGGEGFTVIGTQMLYNGVGVRVTNGGGGGGGK